MGYVMKLCVMCEKRNGEPEGSPNLVTVGDAALLSMRRSCAAIQDA